MLIEDSVPALKALRYCDSNIPAMNKVLFQVKKADAAIDKSSSMLNDKEMFVALDKCLITGCEEELDEMFGESGLGIEMHAIFL